MPTNDELHAADQRLEARIKEVERQRAHDSKRLAAAEDNIAKLDQFMVELRDSLATKEDIAGLRADLREREALHERLDHYRERLSDMERDDSERDDARETRKGRALEWIVIGLVALEGAIELLMYLGQRHG